MRAMKDYVARKKADPAGVDAAALSAFESWITERAGVAEETKLMAFDAPHGLAVGAARRLDIGTPIRPGTRITRITAAAVSDQPRACVRVLRGRCPWQCCPWALTRCTRASDPVAPPAAGRVRVAAAAGLPTPKVPADNPMTVAKVELGRRLFHDTRLSGNGTFACATCHQQAHAFTDGRARAVGSTGRRHARSTMTLTNVAYNASLGWADPSLRRSRRRWPCRCSTSIRSSSGLRAARRRSSRASRRSRTIAARFRAAFPARRPPVTLAEHRQGDRRVRADARVGRLAARSLPLSR